MLLFFLILAVAAAATVWRAKSRIAAAEAAYPPEGRLVTALGQAVHLVELGDPAAPPVVLIHGASASTRDMTFRLAPRLARTYRVIVVDRPGLGWSEASPLPDTIFRQAEVIRAATQGVGATRPIVLGHSYGGAVALAWATAYPDEVTALVTVSGPSHPWDTPLSAYYKALSTPGLRHVAAWLVAAWVPDQVVRTEVASVFDPQPMPDGYLDAFGAGMTLRPSTLLANAAQRASLLDEVTAMTSRYDRLTMPFEILHGTADDIVSPKIHAEPMVLDVPEARYTPLEGIGHAVQNVVPDDVAAAVDRAAARAGLR